MDWIGLYAHKQLVTATADTAASKIAKMMIDHHIGSVVITKDGEIQGLVTERDICRKIVGARLEADSSVEKLVDTGIPRMHMDATITDAVNMMHETGYRYLFVLDKQHEKVVGVVSMQDLIRALKEKVEQEAEALRQYIGGM